MTARSTDPAAGITSGSADVETSAPARLRAFFDHRPFRVIAAPSGGGMMVGHGRTGGVPAVAFACDPAVQGGAMGAAGCAAIGAAYDLALQERVPVVGLWHSGGARLADGVASLHGVGTVFATMTRASGVVPQISVVVGPAAGGAAYGPALTDIVIMSQRGRIFVTGPDVVRSVTGEAVDMAELGGPIAHSQRSGVAHVVTGSDVEAIGTARRLVKLFGSPGCGRRAMVDRPDPSTLLPESPRRAYDVHPLVESLLDEPGIELQARWAPNLVTVLGRLGGRTVGVVANNPLRLGGCLNTMSAEKAARFVRMCDAFGVPLVVVVDVPGYLPGVNQEWEGVVRRGAKLLHAFAEAEVPRVTLVTRKAYGGAYIAMNSRSLGATRVFAWPTARIAVMGAVAAVRILHRRLLAATAEGDRARLETELAERHEQTVGDLRRAVRLGVVDEVIEPARSRHALANAIHQATPGRGHHGNIPL